MSGVVSGVPFQSALPRLANQCCRRSEAVELPCRLQTGHPEGLVRVAGFRRIFDSDARTLLGALSASALRYQSATSLISRTLRPEATAMRCGPMLQPMAISAAKLLRRRSAAGKRDSAAP